MAAVLLPTTERPAGRLHPYVADRPRTVPTRLQRRRAQVRLGLAVALLLVLVLALARVPGGGAGASASVPPAARPGQAPAVLVVEPGDTLWSIARRLQPTGDVRPLVHTLAELNGGAALEVGQRLILPG